MIERKQLRLDRSVSAKIANLSFLCSLLVVFIHAKKPAIECRFIAEFVSVLVQSAVPFFFVFSGFFLGRHMGDSGWWREAVSRRIFTLGAPYIFWLLVMLGIIFFEDVSRNVIAGKDLFSELRGLCGGVRVFFGLSPFYDPNIVSHWYLRTLFGLVVISPLLAFSIKRAGVLCYILLLAADIFIVYLCKTGELSEVPGWGVFFLRTVSPRAFLFFSIGIAIGIGKILPMLSKRGAIKVFVIGMMVLIFVPSQLRIFKVIVEELCLLALMRIIWAIVPSINWPLRLTSLAFPIYLMHVICIDVYASIAESFHLTGVGWMGVFSEITFAVLCSSGVYFLMPKLMPRLSSLAFGGRVRV